MLSANQLALNSFSFCLFEKKTVFFLYFCKGISTEYKILSYLHFSYLFQCFKDITLLSSGLHSLTMFAVIFLLPCFVVFPLSLSIFNISL